MNEKQDVTKEPAKKTAATRVKAGKAVPATKAEKAAKPAKAVKAAAAPAVSKPEAVKAEKAVKPEKAVAKKPKLVRDSFTFPETEYKTIGVLKQRALASGREVKKSELLRAGLSVLAGLADARFAEALDGVEKLKAGRPGKK